MPLWQGRTNIKISLNQKRAKNQAKHTDTKKHEKYANNEEGNGIT